MEAGTYNIVPCLFDANLEGNFSLVVYASSDFELVHPQECILDFVCSS